MPLGADGPARNLRVRLRMPNAVRQIFLASPGRDQDVPVPFEEADGAVTFMVPEVPVYEIAVLTQAKGTGSTGENRKALPIRRVLSARMGAFDWKSSPSPPSKGE